MKPKKLCLVSDPTLYEIVNGVDIEAIYIRLPKFMRIIRYIHHKIKRPSFLRKIWLGNWRKKIQDYEHIIIFDSIYDYFPLEYIRKYNTKCEISFCFRNRIGNRILHSSIIINPNVVREKFNLNMWSYNHDDCNQYNMNYYNQFNIINPNIKDLDLPIEYDIFFWGSDKGRLKILEELYKKLSMLGYKCKFGVVPDEDTPAENKNSTLIESSKKYESVLIDCKKSKCILDIVGETNSGITFRTLESIILKKKLITNYKAIIDTDFYDPENMFILDFKKEEDLITFMDTEYKDTNIDIAKFSFKHFCDTVFNNVREPLLGIFS